MKAPRLRGAALKAFVAAIESPIGGPLIDKLLRDSGIDRFRACDAGDASPMPPPLPHPDPLPETAHPNELCDRAAMLPEVAAHAELETVQRFQRAYASGIDPQSVFSRLESAVARFDQEEKLAFFIARHPDEVARDAAASAARHKERAPLSALDGVPVVIKNEIDVKGFASTLGTRFLTTPADKDAVLVQRLRRAGAVIVGVGNMNEIGINPIGLNPHWGTCRNPWDKSRITGGSSSASAATVAAGLCPISIGADGGGSIRIPAALCGVVGLKATHGRVPETGVPALCWNVGHAGPMGLTVADVAAAYCVIAGRDEGDVASWHQPPPSLEGIEQRSLRGVRLGICRPYFEDADKDVVARCQATVDACVGAGAIVVEVPAPDLNTILWSHSITILSEMRTAMLRHIQEGVARFGYDSRTNLALATRFRSTDVMHALRHRHRLARELFEVMRNVDAIVTPTTAMTAPPIPQEALPDGESNLPVVDALMRFIRLANLTGFPALSVPAGFDGQGLPVGVHLTGRPWEEHLLLRLGRVIEATTEVRRPRLHARLLTGS